MTPIYKGHDCSKRASRPKLTLRIDNREVLAQPDTIVTLSLLDVHRECDPACYTWEQRLGGGRLIIPVGPTVQYQTPEKNKDCENDAVIEAYAGPKLLDTAYVTISPYAIKLCTGKKPYTPLVPPIAYAIVGDEPYGAPHSGSMYLKPIGSTPAGVKLEQGAIFPDGWKRGDLVPKGIEIQPGAVIPPDWPASITWELATEYLSAWYLMTYYDCRGQICWIRQRPKLFWWGVMAPVARLESRFGDLRGAFYDYRTKEMKAMGCCPPKTIKALWEKL